MFNVQLLIFLLSLTNFVCGIYDERGTVRRTEYGLVRGRVAQSRVNPAVQYHSFKGVRYARPPLGRLRFQEALPPLPWSNLQDAVEHREICMQFDDDFTSTDVVGSEDCLYLDVYVPITARTNNQKMPVMVWIHGGNWVSLSTNSTEPDYFMEKPVVIVQVEYRLNVFGFLTTLDHNAKGNLGLKDQVMALKWIQRNIHHFDGDRSRVTLFGVSAGGAAVFYHMLSPLSKGLITGGISQSGSPLNTWTVQRNPLDKTLRLARAFGITSTNTNVIVRELQRIPPETLFRAAFNYSIVGYFTPYDPQPFSSVIERKSPTAFISEPFMESLEKGAFARIPIIMGIGTEEGSYSWGCVLQNRIDINMYERTPQLLIPETMNIPPRTPCHTQVLDSITKRYFPNGNYIQQQQWLPYMSMNLFVRGILEIGSYVYDIMPVYFYQFSFVGSRPTGYLGGTGHMEEMQYLWYPQGFQANPNETARDRVMRHRLITLWTNFAATRNPTPQPDRLLQHVRWPTIKNLNQNYLNIGDDLTVQKPLPYGSDMEFWYSQFLACGYPDPDPNKPRYP